MKAPLSTRPCPVEYDRTFRCPSRPALLHGARQAGSVLLVCLLTAAIMGVTLTSYLALTHAQNTSVMRSQVWNSAMAMSEAGVEDAMAMINKHSGNWDLLPTWTNNSHIVADNWTDLGDNVYYVRRFMDRNSWGTNYYDVYITNRNDSPTITSVGTVQWNYGSAPPSYFATIGTLDAAQPLACASRSLGVSTEVDPLFAVAMAAVRQIDFSGNNVTTDSFDSADPLFSANGLYPFGQVNKQKAAGDVATSDLIINSVNVGNANIKGQVKTGPGGTINIGPNGSVGDKAWVEGGNLGIKPGHSANDMNVQFPNVTLPSASWSPAIFGPYWINGKLWAYAILSSGDYSIPYLDTSLYVGTNVKARIRMDGDVKLTGSGDDFHLARGSQVSLYMTAASFSIKGNGIVNENGNASSFYYFGLPANTTVSFGGNASFTGAVYAPQADFTLGGGGNTKYDFIGASITKSVKMNGHFNFHYDENLRRVGPGRGYIPWDWGEL